MFRFVCIFFLLFISCTIYSQKNSTPSCTEDAINQLWASVSKELNNTHNYKRAISDLKVIIQCSIDQKDTTNWAYARLYETYCYMHDDDHVNMKNSLDELLIYDLSSLSNDDNTSILSSAYFLYGMYYKLKLGLVEPSILYFQSAIDLLLDHINYGDKGDLDVTELSDIFNFQVADLFNNAAVIYLDLGDYEKAAAYFNIAKKVISKDGTYKNWEKAKKNQNLGLALHKIGKYPEALSEYKIAEALLNKETEIENRDKILAVLYKNMAEYYSLNGKKDSTYFFLEKAMTYQTKPAYKIYLLRDYSSVLLNDKRYDEANEKLDAAQDYILETYSVNHPEMAINYQTRASIAANQKQFAKADSLFTIALQILSGDRTKECNCSNLKIEELIDKREAVTTLTQKANALSLANKNEEAIICFDVLASLVKELQQKYIISDASRLQFAKQTKDVYENAIRVAVLAKNNEKAYQFSQLSRSTLLLQQVQQKRAIEAFGIPDSIAAKDQAFKVEINSIQKERENAQYKNKHQIVDDLGAQLFQVNVKYEKWLSSIEESFPNYFNLKYDSPSVSLRNIQKHLKQTEATLIEYFLGKESLFTFVVDQNQVKIYTTPVDEQFNENIEYVYQHIASLDYDYQKFEGYCSAAHQLYQRLLAPAKEDGLINKKNLIIIADEQLNLIPFEALLSAPFDTREKKESQYHKLAYIVKDFNIDYYYSTNLIPYFSTNDQKQKDLNPFVGIAPTFETRTSQINALSFNRSEVNSINQLFDAKTLVGTAASHKSTLQEIQQARIGHFATHATFNDELPLDSRIELADTAFYIYEIFSLPHHLEMVVLSACETASGKRRKGEGVISLARAFTQSGCPSIVASLWKVSDQKTSNLMKSFYAYLFEGKTKSEALGEAKRTYLSEALTKNTHPFYWASFITIGDSSPIIDMATKGFSVLYYLGAFLLLSTLLFLVFNFFKKS